MTCPHAPLDVYELNTRVWLRDLGVSRLAEVPDAVLDQIAARGFSLVWLMGVWLPSEHAARIARAEPALRREAALVLDDFTEDDIVASPYAVARYEVSPLLGGTADLQQIRSRLLRRGIGVLLDFVPNHTAHDHRFVTEHPEYYVRAGPGSVPEETFLAPGGARLMRGRDPYFAPWSDTAQLDYRSESTHRAMIAELRSVARLCDGVRCDMAMLVLSEIFGRTWNKPGALPPAAPDLASGEFWAAAIDAARREQPGFVFMAEAYWGTEPRLHELGFDYTYDKVLYDELAAGRAAGVVGHLSESVRPRGAVRFLENHDEERAAHRFPLDLHRVAALVAMTLPGLRLFHQGQLEGARRKIPVQLARRPVEAADPILAAYYLELSSLLGDPVLRTGVWRLLHPEPAWAENRSHDAFVAYAWDGSSLGRTADGSHRLLVANLAPHAAQCRLRLELPGIVGRPIAIREVFGAGSTPAGDRVAPGGRPVYLRAGDGLAREGLFVDLPPRTGQVLRVETASLGA